jgi:hypothetical protein
MAKNWTENDIQSLKAQEAKDLAVSFLHKLESKAQAPITPGQVQLKELEYELKLKEAEATDRRQHEEHVERTRQLELEIETEKRRHAEAEEQASEVRQQHAELLQRVQSSQEALSLQLERATRQHNVKIEALELEFTARREQLTHECDELTQSRDVVSETIRQLTEIATGADDIAVLRDELDARKTNYERELEELAEAFEAAQFEKQKSINQTRRDQEVELAEIEAQHRKLISEENLKTARSILKEFAMVPLYELELESLRTRAEQHQEKDEQSMAAIRDAARAELKISYNITMTETLDVTELFYREKSIAKEIVTVSSRMQDLETEISRMRLHIELEPDRIAKAVAAARVQVQNNIESAGKR